MPLSTTWQPLYHVGSARGNGSGCITRADAQIGGAIWGRQLAGRANDLPLQPTFRGAELLCFSQTTATPPCSRQGDGSNPRQRALPPCRSAGGLVTRQSHGAGVIILAALQPRIESN